MQYKDTLIAKANEISRDRDFLFTVSNGSNPRDAGE
nr:MAG TPA: hypothetical protein [Caudoviricetes sp.]